MVELSIIIPTLNEEENIKRCILSLENQSIQRDKYEIIVVDGGSIDKTVDIAGRYANKVIKQKSKGLGGARKEGAKVSTGEILVFTDADTMHTPNWLEIILKNLKGGKYDVSTGPVLFYDENFESVLLQLWRGTYRLFHMFNFYRMIGSNITIKREAYQKINGHSDISILEDLDISIKVHNGKLRTKYDKRQKVYTSARRINKLAVYFLIFAYGHYHYLNKDYNKLLNYPSFDKMDLKSILERHTQEKIMWSKS